MTARDRLQRTRTMLIAGVSFSAIAWGVGVTLSILAIAVFAGSFANTPRAVAAYALPFALLLGFIAAGVIVWNGRRVVSEDRVALWLEEQLPRLQYALVTAIEPHEGDARALESIVGREDIGEVTRRAIRRSVLPAAAALVAGALLLYVLPSSAFARSALLARITGGGNSSSTVVGNRLNALRVEVTPPGYAGQKRQTLDDPQSVRALVGSRVVVLGVGSHDGVKARIGDNPASVAGSGSTWRTEMVMPDKAAALTLTDRSYERVLVLEPQIDEVPEVTLVSPVHDTTLRTPQLVVKLVSRTTDDVALTSGYYEYLITSGSGEVFTGRTVTTPVVNFNGARSATLEETLDLKTLKLTQGDVVSIRAIVRDANTLSGPSIGTSDTRTIRIARANEYDSVSIEAAAPPPVDSTAISQRMLILMTEALVKKEKTLARAEFVKQATDIGTMEDRIRKRVYDILYQTESKDAPSDEEEADTETHAILNKDLKEAYDALWDAVRSLQIAEPRPALPPMRIALAALDRARLAQRLYLRGTPPKIVVDLQRVRLTGKDKGGGNERTPRTFADSTRVKLSARFNAVIDVIDKQPARAMTELALLKVESLSSFPEFANALGDAAAAIRAGKDATIPLLRARRALEGTPRATPELTPWAGGG